MANSTAKLRDDRPVPIGKPGDKVPVADIDGLEFSGFGRFYVYTHEGHSWLDIVKPGYFDGAVQKNAGQYLGAIVLINAGGGAADRAQWSHGLIQIIQVRGAAGVSRDEPTMVKIVESFGKGTPVRHGGAAAKAA